RVQIGRIWITRSPQLPKDVRCCGAFFGSPYGGIRSDALACLSWRAYSLNGNRFVTHISLVRVNQIEVSPNRSIGEDESDNTLDKVRARRDAFTKSCPNGRMTWGLTRLALNDQRQQYKDVRRQLAGYHDRYADEITFHPGGYFAPMYNTREEIRQNIREGLRLISDMVGGNYRP